MDSSIKNRLLSLLNSRKVLTALAAVLAIVLARVGLDVPQETVMTIAALAIALIFAIAGEDMAQKAGSDVASKQIDTYLNERDLSEAESVRLERELATLRNDHNELIGEYNKRVDEKQRVVEDREQLWRELTQAKQKQAIASVEAEFQAQEASLMEHTIDELIEKPPAVDLEAWETDGGAPGG